MNSTCTCTVTGADAGASSERTEPKRKHNIDSLTDGWRRRFSPCCRTRARRRRPTRRLLACPSSSVILLASLLTTPYFGAAYTSTSQPILRTRRCGKGVSKTALADQRPRDHESSFGMSRRHVLYVTSAAVLSIVTSHAEPAAASDTILAKDTLNDVKLGRGEWAKASTGRLNHKAQTNNDALVPATFATYAARFLIHYDDGVKAWWKSVDRSCALMTEENRRAKLGRAFGGFSLSVQLSLDDFLNKTCTSSSPLRDRFLDLLGVFQNTYGTDREAKRQICILFATLPALYQPVDGLKQLSTGLSASSRSKSPVMATGSWSLDYTALLPKDFTVVQSTLDNGGLQFTIDPAIALFQVGIDEEFGQTATATPFGPLATTPLKRDLPQYSPNVYAMFGISGATGCALTHTAVLPLDVLKTKAQTDPATLGGQTLWDAATAIVEKEGIEGLLLGAQATVFGYLWYGLSVYPSYTFFKRVLGQTLFSPEVAAIHTNDITLVAGAIAAVFASVGLTPLECCRIRSVAEPEKYRSIGLLGTLREVSLEDPTLGWRTLYAGFPSLLTRQVIFGSVKFLAFERACESIFGMWPMLHDATWTSLVVSLVAGGMSGALSSVVSQPADSVLTYVAQNRDGRSSLGVFEGCRIMVEEQGPGSLFRGLGSRCVWAGSIIAGQFLLYDVFRTAFGVAADDLSQVYQVVITSQS